MAASHRRRSGPRSPVAGGPNNAADAEAGGDVMTAASAACDETPFSPAPSRQGSRIYDDMPPTPVGNFAQAAAAAAAAASSSSVGATTRKYVDAWWQKSPAHLLQYRVGHLHFYGWIPFLIPRNIKATVLGRASLQIQGAMYISWALLIQCTGLGLPMHELHPYVRIFGTPWMGAIFNMSTVVTFILGLFVSLVVQRWWDLRVNYSQVKGGTMDLAMLFSNYIGVDNNGVDYGGHNAHLSSPPTVSVDGLLAEHARGRVRAAYEERTPAVIVKELIRYLNLAHLLLLASANYHRRIFKDDERDASPHHEKHVGCGLSEWVDKTKRRSIHVMNESLCSSGPDKPKLRTRDDSLEMYELRSACFADKHPHHSSRPIGRSYSTPVSATSPCTADSTPPKRGNPQSNGIAISVLGLMSGFDEDATGISAIPSSHDDTAIPVRSASAASLSAYGTLHDKSQNYDGSPTTEHNCAKEKDVPAERKYAWKFTQHATADERIDSRHRMEESSAHRLSQPPFAMLTKEECVREGLIVGDEWSILETASSLETGRYGFSPLVVYFWISQLLRECAENDLVLNKPASLPIMLNRVSELRSASSRVLMGITTQLPYAYVHVVSLTVHFYQIILASWMGFLLHSGFPAASYNIELQTSDGMTIDGRMEDKVENIRNSWLIVLAGYTFLFFSNIIFQGLLDMHTLLDNPFGCHPCKFPIRMETADLLRCTKFLRESGSGQHMPRTLETTIQNIRHRRHNEQHTV